ncbi:hypothetical protein LOTGIDRAFT_218343 [Lottia gigantea]|uniref:Nicotinamide phosphoribosyltransferase n=1 Tax=Lottia gigantea TaxID=225164 RepID=V3ZZS3_LOTGI|nr:hypothetical protein LOTGIDRAFT_218343 [Lottia gigantea]ESO89877.1 hypothetical protein LOTGIDRAFT_218343 [Lottia gigantea]
MAAFLAGGTDNLLFVTDSYKVTHHRQYPPNTTKVYSYFESRGGKFPNVCFFGLQYIIKRWLIGPVITKDKIKEAKELYKLHFGADYFNEHGWNYIVEKHGGYLPIKIKAVPEGKMTEITPIHFTTVNLIFSVLLQTIFVQVWYPMTVATNSRYQKEIIAQYLNDTADDLSGLPFKLHDFGFRGASSVESAGIGGMSHLVNFKGTDTIAGILTAKNYYHCDIAGFSIPAAEHSTITTWGREGEIEAFRNMLTQFPTGLVAVVSDSYNIWNACEEVWGGVLKDLVVSRDGKGTLVIRPDSGDPATVVVKTLNILGEKFGFKKNRKGFKVLPSYLRLIQGDGISYESLGKILEHMKENEWSADNLAFGSGGALLQRLDRDTQKCAFKCSFAVVNDGNEVNVFKEPITDVGKKSKKGRLSLELQGTEYVTVQEGKGDPNKDQLITVYENGHLLKDFTFEEVRKNAEIDLEKQN